MKYKKETAHYNTLQYSPGLKFPSTTVHMHFNSQRCSAVGNQVYEQLSELLEIPL